MGQKNLAFLGSACNFLALAGRDRIDITSLDLPFKIGHEDDIFKELFAILSDKFFKPDEFYHHALSGAIEFVYKVRNVIFINVLFKQLLLLLQVGYFWRDVI